MANLYLQEDLKEGPIRTTIVDLSNINITEENMDYSDCYATKLPVEVIIHLMEFLPYPDRMAAAQTCRLWHEALRYPKFVSQEKVMVRKNVTGYQTAFSAPSTRPYPHLVLSEIEISPKARDFWLGIMPSLRSLYISNCDLCERMFIDLMSRCRRLESLALDNCRELFMPGRLLSEPEDTARVYHTFQRIRELNLSCNRYLSDAMLNRLLAWMPNLETISLEGCQISFHTGLYMKYYPERITLENPRFASDTVLTFKNFCKILELLAPSVRVLNFSRTLIDSPALTAIAEMKGLRLAEIHLSGCEQLTNAGVMSLARLQASHLTELDLSRCMRVTDQALVALCADATRLRRLRLRSCRAITDHGIEQLSKLNHLIELDISMCEQVTGEGIEIGVCSQVNWKFRRLMMEGLATLGTGTIEKIAQNLPDLTHLSLSYCLNAVTDETIQAIFCFQRRLRWLRLAGCDQLTDAGLTGLGLVVPGIEAARLRVQTEESPHRIALGSRAEQEILKDAQRNMAVQQLCEVGQEIEGFSLSQLSGLQDLDIRSCNKISDISLKYAFRLKELQHLNLSQCQQITVDGLRALSVQCPSIDSLSLANCYNISDEGIESVVANLKRLKHLDIKGCNKLTGATVDAVLKHGRQLRYLDASSCGNMADAVAVHINRLPAQTYYGRSDCPEPCRPAAPPLPR